MYTLVARQSFWKLDFLYFGTATIYSSLNGLTPTFYNLDSLFGVKNNFFFGDFKFVVANQMTDKQIDGQTLLQIQERILMSPPA